MTNTPITQQQAQDLIDGIRELVTVVSGLTAVLITDMDGEQGEPDEPAPPKTYMDGSPVAE